MVKPTTSLQSSSSQTGYVSDINCNNTNTSGSSSSSSKYKGVRKRKWGKWVSEIRLPNSRERIWLGSYDSPVKAARAFDAALYCLRGRDAKFNFPENPPEIAGGRSLKPSEIQEAAARFAKDVETTTAGNDNNDNAGSITERETTSSSVEHEDMTDDWSFLSMLDISTNDQVVGMSDYGYYSGLGHFSGYQFSPPPTAEFFAPPPIDDDQNGGDVFSQSSFLWNF